MCICLYLFYCPSARKQKLKQNPLHCKATFCLFPHTIFSYTDEFYYFSVIFVLKFQFCLFHCWFFLLGFESFNQLSLRSHLELHSISWAPSVQITSNPLVQEDNFKNLGVVWSNILWVGKLYTVRGGICSVSMLHICSPLTYPGNAEASFSETDSTTGYQLQRVKGILRPGSSFIMATLKWSNLKLLWSKNHGMHFKLRRKYFFFNLSFCYFGFLWEFCVCFKVTWDLIIWKYHFCISLSGTGIIFHVDGGNTNLCCYFQTAWYKTVGVSRENLKVFIKMWISRSGR